MARGGECPPSTPPLNETLAAGTHQLRLALVHIPSMCPLHTLFTLYMGGEYSFDSE